MAKAHLHEPPEERQRSTDPTADQEHHGGLVGWLWLLVLLIVEVELIMWTVERAYGH